MRRRVVILPLAICCSLFSCSLIEDLNGLSEPRLASNDAGDSGGNFGDGATTDTASDAGLAGEGGDATAGSDAAAASDANAGGGDAAIDSGEGGDANGGTVPMFANLEAWFDASDTSSLVMGAGSSVAQWNDKSGNDRHAAQSTAALQPMLTTVGGKNYVRFEGGSGCQNLTWAAPLVTEAFTMIAAAFQDAPKSNASFTIVASQGDGYFSIADNGGSYASVMTENGTFYVEATAPSGNTLILPHVVSVSLEAAATSWANAQAHLDGVALAVGNSGYYPGSAVAKMVGLGNTNTSSSAAGHVAEVVVYSRVLTTSERQDVERYLKMKWGTP